MGVPQRDTEDYHTGSGLIFSGFSACLCRSSHLFVNPCPMPGVATVNTVSLTVRRKPIQVRKNSQVMAVRLRRGQAKKQPLALEKHMPAFCSSLPELWVHKTPSSVGSGMQRRMAALQCGRLQHPMG